MGGLDGELRVVGCNCHPPCSLFTTGQFFSKFC